MPLFPLLLFVLLAVWSTYLQVQDRPLKKWVSPGLTAFSGLLVFTGALQGTIPLEQGWAVGIALFLLAGSDFLFERSSSNPGLFPLAMILGVLSGFTLGILFNLNALRNDLSVFPLATFLIIGVFASAFVYRFLEVEPALRIAVYIYLLQAVILLTGGLASFFVGEISFGIWGLLIFVSDSLVGIRAFPSAKRAIPWLTPERILGSILTIYYPAQFALVYWALFQ